MGSKNKKKHIDETPSSSSSPSTSDYSESSPERCHRHRKDWRRKDGSSRREKERKREKRKRKEKERERKRRKLRREDRKKKKRDHRSDSESQLGPDCGSGSDSEGDRGRVEPQVVVEEMLKEFPNVGNDLKQLLQMIDDGQAVDIKGISERSLNTHLKKLFLSLNLKENGDRVFLLSSNARPTLDVVGHLIQTHTEPEEQQPKSSVSAKDAPSIPEHAECSQVMDENNLDRDDSATPKRRVIGPEMPSAELLAAAAKLTEAQAELREAELEEDNELFIGPPPPALVAEAESANEAERFEEVTRIMGVEADCPYDVIGANRNMSADNIKKKYWKLSLLVHPDKCTHPQAHQAFIILNKAFKELQDPDKRKAMDEKIKLKEEQEEFKAELRAMREAAQWRRLQGISMEGDDELLAEVEVKVPPKRDEWMTTLPPERKPGVTMQSTRFSKSSKEGRGDTSGWIDTPMERAQKAKMHYLEAYNEAAALASNEDDKKRTNSDADLVDIYNKEKRSKSLVQKHQEETAKCPKKKSKQQAEKAEWEGKHPWKPWDREKDLVAGRHNVKLDTDNMAKGLTSRFSSGTFQRNFL
ncbi:DnaJ domain - like 10 [Theobroma cacao]|nr:DnaJ domain - like 10 [Theobroma cacao]